MKKWLLSTDQFHLINENSTYKELLTEVKTSKDKIKGIYFLTDDDGIKSIVSDGDFRRGFIKGYAINTSLKLFSNENFLYIDKPVNESLADDVYKLIIDLFKSSSLSEIPRFIPVVCNGQILNIIDSNSLILVNLEKDESLKRIAVIGLGYVGLTLTAHLAQKNYKVIGYDVNVEIIKALNSYEYHIEEPLLGTILKDAQQSGHVKFENMSDIQSCDYYIVCVGTSLKSGELNSLPVLSAMRQILKVAKQGEHIFLRSTVPLGFTRELAKQFDIPLEDNSVTNKPNLSFTPERTVEGNALWELEAIPQVIGSFSLKSLRSALEFWGSISSSVIECTNPEESEAIKLASNTYRDMTFGFSNYIALACEKYSLNAFQLIRKANEGYPRNNLALPSPGVGGYCLTKDPILFESTQDPDLPKICSSARNINNIATMAPIRALENWVKKYNLHYLDIKILVIGIAFKGKPATSDLRHSTSLEITNYLDKKSIVHYAYDEVISKQEFLPCLTPSTTFVEAKNVQKVIGLVDGIIIMNNHPDHQRLNISEFLAENNKFPKFFFDGWSQFNKLQTFSSSVHYSTMGITK